MKLKNIGALCRSAKSIHLYDDEERQWVGEGGAIYLLPDNLGHMTTATLCTIFDIPPDKAAELYTCRSEIPETLDTADDAEEDELEYDSDRRVLFEKRDMLPLRLGSGEVYFVQTKYLKAVDDSENLRMTLRLDGERRPYIAVKDGMFLTAILMPVLLPIGTGTWLTVLASGAKQAGMEHAG